MSFAVLLVAIAITATVYVISKPATTLPTSCSTDILESSMELAALQAASPLDVDCGGYTDAYSWLATPAASDAAIGCAVSALAQRRSFVVRRVNPRTDTIEYEWLVGTREGRVVGFFKVWSALAMFQEDARRACGQLPEPYPCNMLVVVDATDARSLECRHSPLPP